MDRPIYVHKSNVANKHGKGRGEAVWHCGLSIGLVITRSQVQCLDLSVVVAVDSLGMKLYSHCSSPPGCIAKWENLSHQYCDELGNFSQKSSTWPEETFLVRGYHKNCNTILWQLCGKKGIGKFGESIAIHQYFLYT